MDLDTRWLREDTRAAWHALRAQPALSGFVLVGGTALTLRLGHRVSEDLDFAWPDRRLPRRRLEAFRRSAEEAGLSLHANDDPSAVEDFLDTGLDLLDYHQVHLLDETVKVTFWAPDEEHRRLLDAGAPVASSGPRVAELHEVFGLKCLVCAERSKTRDWFDLFILLQRGRFTVDDFIAVFDRAGVPAKREIALSRLCAGRPGLQDEGFESLLPQAPTLAEMTGFFEDFRDRLQQLMAARALREATAPTSPTADGHPRND